MLTYADVCSMLTYADVCSMLTYADVCVRCRRTCWRVCLQLDIPLTRHACLCRSCPALWRCTQAAGSHFTCFTGAKVQALTQQRSYGVACLVDAHLLMLPRLPEGLLDKLQTYAWAAAPYMALTHKGSMRLPLCFRPSALDAKFTRSSVQPPAGGEAAGARLLFWCTRACLLVQTYKD